MRIPAVAGQFYPGSQKQLAADVKSMLSASSKKTKKKAYAAVSPHAGYIYSGQLAADTLGILDVPETVILIGPNHRGKGERVALSTVTWETPLGAISPKNEITKQLQDNSPLFQIDENAHQNEHSLEVQLPLLQLLQKNLHIVPILVAHLSYSECEIVAKAIADTIKLSGQEVLTLASSDMNHYESREKTQQKDSLAIQAIRDFSAPDLYQIVHQHSITMCGVIPTVISILVAKQLGANRSEIIGYTDSGHVSGDTDQVVGYAGILFS